MTGTVGWVTETGRLMALDSASMYFRAFHGVPITMTAPDGTPVNAVRGFLDAIARLIGDFRPTALIAAFDADWRPQWRVDAVPSYKAHRVAGGADAAAAGVDAEEVPDLLEPQVPIIEAVLDALGLARIGVAGFEADDVLGTLAATWPTPVDVVTGDRDLFQVVDDTRGVRVLYNARGYAKLEVLDAAGVVARHAVTPQQYADLALLRGDTSDGLPGVAGVGEKTAAGLIARFGSVAALLTALDDPTIDVPKRPALSAARDYLVAADPVVRVRTDVPLPQVHADLTAQPHDPDALAELSHRWGLASSIQRVGAAIAATTSDTDATTVTDTA